MAITSAICSSFKQELLQGKHSFESSGGHTFKIALFTSSASLGAATTDYSTSNEISLFAWIPPKDLLKFSTVNIFIVVSFFLKYLLG